MKRLPLAVRLSALVAASFGLSGCCGLAAYFCGPDRSEWTSVDYATPDAALVTLLEALRRDARAVVQQSLSESFKQANGLYSLEFAIAWEEVNRRIPALHVLGQADVGDRTELAPDRVSFILRAAGEQVRIEFQKQSYWEFAYRVPDERDPIPVGEYLPGPTIREFLTSRVDADEGTVQIALRLPEAYLDGIEPEAFDVGAIERISAGSDWKVAAIEPIPES